MDCLQTDQRNQPGFFDRLNASGKRIPLSGSLEVTQRCNLRCVHCYVGESRFAAPSVPELTTREITGLLDQVAEAGCLWMLLTGGEPLLRPDLTEIYSHARQIGLLTTIFTNGTLLTPSFANLLADQPPIGIEITLYGATRPTYEKITGVTGSFERCMRGINLLVERKLPLKLKTVLLSNNFTELDAMSAISDSLNLEPFRYDAMIAGSLDQSGDPLAFRLSPEQVVALDMSDKKRVAEYQSLYDISRQQAGKAAQKLYVCGAGRNTFHIDPTGHLSACIISRARTYDLRSGSFQEGWNDFLRKEADLPAPVNSPCSSCDKVNLCGRCVGRTELEPHSISFDQDFFCRVGHLRAAALDSKPSNALIGEISQ